MNKKSTFAIFSSSYLGNMVELFDFALCGILLSIFGDIFFPPSLAGFFSGSLVFFMGALLRPFGGVVIGKIGDTYGRRAGVFISIIGMGVATLGMAFLPTFESIGILSCVGFVFLRFLQSFCMGGESPGAIIFLMEHLKKIGKTNLSGIFATSNMVAFMGVAVAAYLINTSENPKETWRYAFMIGGAFSLIALLIRFYLDETPEFIDSKKFPNEPILNTIKLYKYHLTLGIVFSSYAGALSYFNASFIPRYVKEYLQIAGNEVFLFSFISQGIMGLCIFFCARWIQQKNLARKAAYMSFFMGALLPIPISIGLVYGSLFLKTLCAFSFFIPLSITGATFYHLIVELFPVKHRYVLTALSLNVGIAVFGGMQPMVNSWLIYKTGVITAPAFFICFISFMFIGIIRIKGVNEVFWKTNNEESDKVFKVQDALKKSA